MAITVTLNLANNYISYTPSAVVLGSVEALLNLKARSFIKALSDAYPEGSRWYTTTDSYSVEVSSFTVVTKPSTTDLTYVSTALKNSTLITTFTATEVVGNCFFSLNSIKVRVKVTGKSKEGTSYTKDTLATLVFSNQATVEVYSASAGKTVLKAGKATKVKIVTPKTASLLNSKQFSLDSCSIVSSIEAKTTDTTTEFNFSVVADVNPVTSDDSRGSIRLNKGSLKFGSNLYNSDVLLNFTIDNSVISGYDDSKIAFYKPITTATKASITISYNSTSSKLEEVSSLGVNKDSSVHNTFTVFLRSPQKDNTLDVFENVTEFNKACVMSKGITLKSVEYLGYDTEVPVASTTVGTEVTTDYAYTLSRDYTGKTLPEIKSCFHKLEFAIDPTAPAGDGYIKFKSKVNSTNINETLYLVDRTAKTASLLGITKASDKDAETLIKVLTTAGSWVPAKLSATAGAEIDIDDYVKRDGGGVIDRKQGSVIKSWVSDTVGTYVNWDRDFIVLNILMYDAVLDNTYATNIKNTEDGKLDVKITRKDDTVVTTGVVTTTFDTSTMILAVKIPVLKNNIGDYQIYATVMSIDPEGIADCNVFANVQLESPSTYYNRLS